MTVLRRLLLRSVGKLIAWPIRRRMWAFERLCHDPQPVQASLLRQILQAQAATGFGRDHGLSPATTLDEFRKQVPIAPYEYYEPYIARVRRGEIDALLSDDRVLMFALTSGTTAARKFIPVTQRYLADYRRGWNHWGLRAMRAHRATALQPMLQLVGDPDEFRTEAGIPCGSISGFAAHVQKKIIRWLYCVPTCAGRITDANSRLYVALRFALPRPVGMILTANPSTLLNLARLADASKEALLRDIHDGTLCNNLALDSGIRAELGMRLRPNPIRAKQLEASVHGSGHLYPFNAWPADRLLVGTWTGGSVGLYLRQLSRYYGNVPVRDLGLIASEGRFTIPVADATPAGVLDITTHYYEFVPAQEVDSPQPTVLGAHELVEGREYFILPTTPYGLYRYDIRDLVRVTGFHHRTPLLEFLGKGSLFSNLTGEKLSEHHVTSSMAAATADWSGRVSAYSVAPCWNEGKPYYCVFLEQGDVPDLLACVAFLQKLEHALADRNSEYASKRDSGRLGPVRLAVLPDGFWSSWDRTRLAKGGAPEQYKRPCLIGDVTFRETAPVQREICPET